MDNFMEVVNQPAMIRATFEPSSSGVLEENILPMDGEVRVNGPKKVTVVIMERWEVMGELLGDDNLRARLVEEVKKRSGIIMRKLEAEQLSVALSWTDVARVRWREFRMNCLSW